jgi:ElaB/YqjD/DUF883 family membrane-anchored ribosome-binding protein
MTANLETQTLHDLTPGKTSKVDDLIDSANRLGQEAKQAALQHVVRPTIRAARDAGEALEVRARHTSSFFQDTFNDLQDRALESPRRTLGYAFGAGILIGLLLHRR